MTIEQKPQHYVPADEGLGQHAISKNCLVTVILLQVNYVNNGNSPIGLRLHANVEGQDLEDSRNIEISGTTLFPLWYRESRRGRCGSDVEISYVMDISVSPAADISPLDAHLSVTRSYPCPSNKDHEVFTLTVGDPQDIFVTFEFVFRVTLECRDV